MLVQGFGGAGAIGITASLRSPMSIGSAIAVTCSSVSGYGARLTKRVE